MANARRKNSLMLRVFPEYRPIQKSVIYRMIRRSVATAFIERSPYFHSSRMFMNTE